MEFSSKSTGEPLDDWDNVVNFEGRMFENGVKEGRSDAVESREMLENGIQAGFLKGVTVTNTIPIDKFISHINDVVFLNAKHYLMNCN